LAALAGSQAAKMGFKTRRINGEKREYRALKIADISAAEPRAARPRREMAQATPDRSTLIQRLGSSSLRRRVARQNSVQTNIRKSKTSNYTSIL
jgi:hypothetical protein